MLPAAITVISGLTVYFFNFKMKTVSHTAIATMVCVLVVSTSASSYFSAHFRTISINAEMADSIKVRRDDQDHLEQQIKDAKVNRCFLKLNSMPAGVQISEGLVKSCIELAK